MPRLFRRPASIVRALMLVLSLGCGALPAQAQLRLDGTVSYQQPQQDTLVMRADGISNSCPAGASGRTNPIRLSFWILPRRGADTSGGHILAEHLMEPLACQQARVGISSPVMPVRLPLPGPMPWYALILLEQFDGLAWARVESRSFDRPFIDAVDGGPGGDGGGGTGDADDGSQAGILAIEGELSHQPSGDEVLLSARRIAFNCPPQGASGSGPVRLSLWAFAQPLEGPGRYLDQQGGMLLAQHVMGTLSCGGAFENVNSGLLLYSPPPAGTWYYTLALEESLADQWRLVDFRNVAGAVVTDGASSACSALPPEPNGTTLHEFYHRGFQHFFVTADAGEIRSLAGNAAGGWCFTGRKLAVQPISKRLARGLGPVVPVCRFFSGQTFAPKSSHFYTSNAGECDVVKRNPDWRFESEAYLATNPMSDGACPYGTVPLYRLYNNGRTGAPNHRYTTDRVLQEALIRQGWSPEGIGANRVIMCVG